MNTPVPQPRPSRLSSSLYAVPNIVVQSPLLGGKYVRELKKEFKEHELPWPLEDGRDSSGAENFSHGWRGFFKGHKSNIQSLEVRMYHEIGGIHHSSTYPLHPCAVSTTANGDHHDVPFLISASFHVYCTLFRREKRR